MSGTPSGQETPVPFSNLVGTLRFSRPELRPRRRTHDSTWDKLSRNVPKTEADWQTVRRRHDFDSAERIPGTLARLLDPLEESNLHKVVFLAGCSVGMHEASDKAPTYSSLRQFLGTPPPWQYQTTSRISDNMENTKTDSSSLCRSLNLPRRLKAPWSFTSHFYFITCVLTLALGTHLFSEEELQRFASAIRTSRLDSRLPPLPPPITPPIRPIQNFATFDISESLRRKVIKATNQLRGFNPAPPGLASEVDLYAYEWSTVHQAVVDEAMKNLVGVLQNVVSSLIV
ncbi:hypothetical protein FDENT_9622 [Fusarium denticulatum]|uniref:Uncharacterized protein n=1 Tax=Fusarium denticulatum TaxID=48507 RepID=A0A8H5WYP3_9HYPO|nr:hypothetical protein FDENT_9622 [Fusarium denticulatum]